MQTITSRHNAICTHLKKLGEDRSYRHACSEFLCDGIKLLVEALKNSVGVICVLTSSDIPFPLPADTVAYHVTQDVLSHVSPLKNPQDVLFSCGMPREKAYNRATGAYLLLDGIRDPGNIGAIMRTVCAFGLSGVFLANGCADIYNPKTIRASMGAVFMNKAISLPTLGLAGLKNGVPVGSAGDNKDGPAGTRLLGAVSDASAADISEVEFANSIIAIGNEGSGLSGEVLELCDELFTIPIDSRCDSLNAAAAASVIAWEVTRRQRECR